MTNAQITVHFNSFHHNQAQHNYFKPIAVHKSLVAKTTKFLPDRVENIVEQERQIVARYARLTPSCKAEACTKQNSSMKNNKGH